MQGKKVNSSQIQEVAYDEGSREMYIKFVRGDWYVYHNVPEDVYKGLLKEQSAGKYFSAYVKGKYNYAKHVGAVLWTTA